MTGRSVSDDNYFKCTCFANVVRHRQRDAQPATVKIRLSLRRTENPNRILPSFASDQCGGGKERAHASFEYTTNLLTACYILVSLYSYYHFWYELTIYNTAYYVYIETLQFYLFIYFPYMYLFSVHFYMHNIIINLWKFLQSWQLISLA